ncbi:hypothetical protein KM043_010763 [Ampulex compressa]|nr:hypothetical protein KM043_010763 [Ampulex compressa]
MSGPRRSVGPVRQHSLQQPPPHRQPLRRQKSAEGGDKSLQIYANSIGHGRHGTITKSGSTDRPKVRIAWAERRRSSEEGVEQVEVVARQIPGRSRPTTGCRSSKGFMGNDKAAILYSRQELAERLRLAWKHREENRANIDIFLAHGAVEERCDSEISSHATIITAPSTPLPRTETPTLNDVDHITSHEFMEHRKIRGSRMEREGKTNWIIVNDIENTENRDDKNSSHDDEEKDFYVEKGDASIGDEDAKNCTEKATIGDFCTTKNIAEICANTKDEDFEDRRRMEKLVRNQVQQGIKISSNARSENEFSEKKKKSAISIDCNPLYPQASTTFLSPFTKTDDIAENPGRTSKDSSARQKRASFRNCTNRAFFDATKAATIIRCSSAMEKTEADVDKRIVVPRCETSIIHGNTRSTLEIQSPVIDEKSKAFVEKNGAVGKSTNESKVNKEKRAVETTKSEQRPRRTSSAPPQRQTGNPGSTNRLQVNIVIDTPSAFKVTENKMVLDRQEKDIDDKDISPQKLDVISSKNLCGRSIRSAPLKRRSKSAKRRLFATSISKSEDNGKSRNRTSGRGKISVDAKATDVVTMVSLVSSADSDSEAENSPGDDKLIDELRSKLPTTSIIKASISPVASICRKPIKSVSFQEESFDEDLAREQQVSAREERKIGQARFAIVNNRGNAGILSLAEETAPWRPDTPGLALPVLTLIHDIEEAVEVPLTDREKRCLAVPIGDLHDKKRKLLKARSVSSRSSELVKPMMTMEPKESKAQIPMVQSDLPVHRIATPVENLLVKVEPPSVTPAKIANPEIIVPPPEPQFQTTKEKECWHLYKRMCDKGVCVSFDTVLRGMLTPTEYRLRQKQLSQDL